MDVLTAFASTLASDSHKDCLVQLLEHLGQERHRGARKLYAKASNKRRKAACSLKRCFRSIGRNLNGGRGQRDWPADTASDAMRLSSELAKWPNLNRENLHPFRLKVKELRNVLRLSGDDDKFVELLGDVKDRIGEWHDWTELSAIADEVIQHKGRCAIRDQISAGAQARFSHALRIAQQLRDEYFGSTDKGSRRRANSAAMNDSVLKASAKLAT
jgi:CHAD domain-containing protein